MELTPVLIVGAGPTGLVLALWLRRLGIELRIVDQAREPGTTSRAVAVQARTLEFYRQIGLADTVLARGREVSAANLWVAGRQVARAVLGDMGAGVSPYAYAFIFPQDEHERLLIDRLNEAGGSVERETQFIGLEDHGERVVARLKRADGRLESCEAAFVAGCDGAHSSVRDALSVGFAGGTYEHLFYVADVEAGGQVMNGEIHVALDRTDFLALFPLKDAHRARLVGTVRDSAADARRRENLTWDDISRRVIEWMRIEVRRVHWFSTYQVHHRVAERFRRARVFLLGDAAHIHSPVGGQGMNTGIGDAVNLAWKLAAVLRRRADIRILDTYEPERIAFAQRLVATTDQAFTGVTSSSAIARALRLHVVPLLLPALLRPKPLRRLAFRTISQTAINYRGSTLNEGRAGGVHGLAHDHEHRRSARRRQVPVAHGSERRQRGLRFRGHLHPRRAEQGDRVPDERWPRGQGRVRRASRRGPCEGDVRRGDREHARAPASGLAVHPGQLRPVRGGQGLSSDAISPRRGPAGK